MTEDRDRAIRTMKDTKTKQGVPNLEYFKNQENTKRGVIFSQTTNAYQLYIPEEDYYIEASSSQRGVVPEKDNGGFIFDVASAPKSYKEVRNKLIDVAHEKLQNDIHSINSILSRLKEDKKIEEEDICMRDVIERIEDNLK